MQRSSFAFVQPDRQTGGQNMRALSYIGAEKIMFPPKPDIQTDRHTDRHTDRRTDISAYRVASLIKRVIVKGLSGFIKWLTLFLMHGQDFQPRKVQSKVSFCCFLLQSSLSHLNLNLIFKKLELSLSCNYNCRSHTFSQNHCCHY